MPFVQTLNTIQHLENDCFRISVCIECFLLARKKTNPVSKCQSHCVFGWYKWYFLSWYRLTLLESTQRTKKVTLIAVALVSKHSKWYYMLAINYTFFTLKSFIFVHINDTSFMCTLMYLKFKKYIYTKPHQFVHQGKWWWRCEFESPVQWMINSK